MAIFTGIAGAVAALSASTFLSGAVGSFLLKAAVGIGLNLLAQAISGKPEKPTFSINGTLQGGGDLPRSFILGKCATAGSLVWANTWGQDGDTPNGYLTQVIALSDLPVKGLTGLWVNNEKVTFDPNYLTTGWGSVVPEYDKDGNNLWIKFHDGTQTTSDSFLSNTASNGNRSWPATRVGRGVAYAVITARVSKNMFSGIPSFKFEVDGIKLYDPSKDSTNGGTGTHRYSNPSTWGGDGDYNPAVQVYNLLRGIRYNGEWLYGVQGLAAARLPSANWIPAINKCRQTIASAEGFVPQYRSSGEVTVDAALSIALEAINATCLGRISEIGGTYQMFVGTPDAPVVSFHDDDIISTQEQSFTPFFGLADTVNGISATYPSPADGWVVKTAPPIYRPDLEALHGNRRAMSSIEMTFSPYAEQVQRLMKSSLDEAQRARRHTLTLPPKFWAYAVPGVVFSWTSPRNGYINKLMRVDGVVDNANLDVTVDITEVDPSDYDWDSNIDFDPPVDGAVGPLRPQPQPIVDFSAIPAVAKDDNGNDRRPAILLGWDGNKIDVDLVRFEVRQGWNLVTIYTGRTEEVSRGSILIAPFMFIPNKQYQVRARYAVYDDSRDFIWSDWISVTLPDVKLGPGDIYPIDVDQLNSDVKDLLKWQFDALRYTQEELDRQGKIMSDGMSGSYHDRQKIRREISATTGNITASYIEAILVATGPNSALSQRIEQVEVKIDTDVAQAVSALTAEINRVDGDVTAVANSVQALNVSVGKFSANGLFRTTVEATPSGALSRIGISVAASNGAATSSAAIFLDAIAGGQSRAVLNADQVIITNGTNSSYPFTFINGEATMNLARVNEITAGILRSPDSKVVFDLNNKMLVFRD